MEQIALNTQIFISVISGIIGTIVGAIITAIVTYKSINAEKKLFIEIEVLSEKVYSPLIANYLWLLKRKQEYISENQIGMEKIIPLKTFNEIEKIISNNISWIFATKEKTKKLLFEIRETCVKKDEKELLNKLECIYNEVQTKLKKYST